MATDAPPGSPSTRPPVRAVPAIRGGPPPRRTVARRILVSFGVLLVAFAVTAGWSVLAFRQAARDSERLRAGYVPLLLRIGETLAEQNVFTTQLNHITSAQNPGDAREWLETARRARPLTFAYLREAAEGLAGDDGGRDEGLAAFREETLREVTALEQVLAADPARFAQLLQALSAGDRAAAERAQGELIKRESEGASRLRVIKARVEERVERLNADARAREVRSLQLLLGLAALTFAVGVGTSLHARRVLRPLTAVTERAKAVAEGDLTPRDVVVTHDEIGELAGTFESMVAAIDRARAEVVQAERLATIGRMAAHVTHEIRNPLSAIGLNVELLEDEFSRAGDVEASQLLAAIKAEVERLSRIAEQYLSVARRPAPRFEREGLDDLVRELFAFLHPELERARIAVDIGVEPDLPEVELDEAQLRQALINLVRNAREAMTGGGRIRVRLGRAAGGGVELLLEDDGPGIPEELRAAVFDPFFTTKERGTGLGLAVTREIVQAHGGDIVCESAEPRGTRFRIYLPQERRA